MAATARSERKYDLYGEAFRADPFATFATMRANDPVLRQPGFDAGRRSGS